MDQTDKNCRNCEHWDLLKWDADAGNVYGKKDCLRYPPVTGDGNQYFPKTNQEDRCGEFRFENAEIQKQWEKTKTFVRMSV